MSPRVWGESSTGSALTGITAYRISGPESVGPNGLMISPVILDVLGIVQL